MIQFRGLAHRLNSMIEKEIRKIRKIKQGETFRLYIVLRQGATHVRVKTAHLEYASLVFSHSSLAYFLWPSYYRDRCGLPPHRSRFPRSPETLPFTRPPCQHVLETPTPGHTTTLGNSSEFFPSGSLMTLLSIIAWADTGGIYPQKRAFRLSIIDGTVQG